MFLPQSRCPCVISNNPAPLPSPGGPPQTTAPCTEGQGLLSGSVRRRHQKTHSGSSEHHATSSRRESCSVKSRWPVSFRQGAADLGCQLDSRLKEGPTPGCQILTQLFSSERMGSAGASPNRPLLSWKNT